MLTKIGIDLGYANISICDATNVVYREPSIALLEKNTRRVVALGNAALVSEQEQTDNADSILFRPFKNGLIYNGHVTDKIASTVLRSVPSPSGARRVVVGIPSDIGAWENETFLDYFYQGGADYVYSVKRPVAALIGCGYSPMISAISVNIGASATDIAVLHNGKIVALSRAEIGGEAFDTAVKDYIYANGEVSVSLLVARTIKERIGALTEGRESDSVDIEGTLSLTGEKIHITLTSEDIIGVFEAPMQALITAIANTVKKIPLPIVSPIFENGIVLTGGGACLFGMDQLISKVIGIKVICPSDPMGAVARGLQRVNAFLPDSLRINKKDITSRLASYYTERNSAKECRI